MTALAVAVGVAAFAAGIVVGFVVCAAYLDRRQRAELERMGNMLSFGSPTSADPEIVSADPDAAQRVRQQIHEDRVANGIAVLIQRYKDQGLSITEEEARMQVEAMMVGNSPV